MKPTPADRGFLSGWLFSIVVLLTLIAVFVFVGGWLG